MLNDKIKNKIYALASISVIVFIVVSFVLTVNFLLKINTLIFKADEKKINEQSTTLDKDAYNRIKSEIENLKSPN